MSLLVNAVCEAGAPPADSEAAEILSLLREHRASPGPEDMASRRTITNGMEYDAEEVPQVWMREDDALRRRLVTSGRGAEVKDAIPQLDSIEWRYVADHLDDQMSLKLCAPQKVLHPENIKGAPNGHVRAGGRRRFLRACPELIAAS